MKNLIKERIKANKKLFTKEDLKIINNNLHIINKIYLIGLLDGRNIEILSR